MEFRHLAPHGPVLMIPAVHGDERGFFMETWRKNEFDEHCGAWEFVQDNHSKSTKNVLRGLHYQLAHPQGKLVRVTAGRVFDVAVDLRISSPSFGKSFSAILDDVSRHMLWVPPGFAHGFLVLSGEAEFSYKCTAYYAPGDECCLRWNDPALDISWPLPAGVEPVISPRDARGQSFAEAPRYS